MPDDRNLRAAKKGVSALVATLVQTVEQRDPGFEAAFLRRLEKAYREIRDEDAELDGLEILSWTRSLLTGFDHVHGQGAKFLEGHD